MTDIALREALPGTIATKPKIDFRRLALAGLAFLVLSGGSWYGYSWWIVGRFFESTDDAFIAARQFAIAPKVAGYVTAVPVTDNQHVNKGDVIAQIDQRDYRVALAQADAQVTGAQAGIHNIDAQIDTQGAQIAAAQAQVVCVFPADVEAPGRSSLREILPTPRDRCGK